MRYNGPGTIRVARRREPLGARGGRAGGDNPLGARHGSMAATLMLILDPHVSVECLGRVFALGTGAILSQEPDTVRAPDVSFVSRERVPSEGSPKNIGSSPGFGRRGEVSERRPRGPVQSPDVTRIGNPFVVGSLSVHSLRGRLRTPQKDQHLYRRRYFGRGRRGAQLRVQSLQHLRVRIHSGRGLGVFRNRHSWIATLWWRRHFHFRGAFVHTALRAKRRSEQWTLRRT